MKAAIAAAEVSCPPGQPTSGSGGPRVSWDLSLHEDSARADVSGVIRRYDQARTPVVEKSISARVRRLPEANLPADRRVLEGLLNTAIEELVRKVVTDPEVTQHIVAGR